MHIFLENSFSSLQNIPFFFLIKNFYPKTRQTFFFLAWKLILVRTRKWLAKTFSVSKLNNHFKSPPWRSLANFADVRIFFFFTQPYCFRPELSWWRLSFVLCHTKAWILSHFCRSKRRERQPGCDHTKRDGKTETDGSIPPSRTSDRHFEGVTRCWPQQTFLTLRLLCDH